jgi:arylsulfatase A-like enzyme
MRLSLSRGPGARHSLLAIAALLLSAAGAACRAPGPAGERPPDPEAVAITCAGAGAILSGDRIRLAASLESAGLEVRPVSLGPGLSRLLLDSGWDLKRADAEPGRPIVIARSPAMLRAQRSPCADGEAPSHRAGGGGIWVRLADTIGGREGAPNGSSLTISAAGAEPSASELPAGSRDVWVRAPAAPAGLIEIATGRDGEVGLAELRLPLGRLQVDIDHEYRDAIVASSIREARFRVVAPPDARLRLSLGVTEGPIRSLPAARPGGDGSGWTFVVRAGPSGSPVELLRERVMDDRLEGREPWLEWRLDLSRWSGDETEIFLGVEPVGTPRSLALWGSPVVERGPAAAVEAATEATRPDVLLVSLDTLRADRVGRVVNGVELTPVLNDLARESARFIGCRTQAPSTLYGHAAMLTGLSPSGHGATIRSLLPAGVPWLPEILADEGYATITLGDDGLLDGRYGFARGFDRFRSVPEEIEHKTDLALEAFDDLAGPWFMLFHSYAVHMPYAPPEDLTSHLSRGYAGPLGADIDAVRVKEAVTSMNQGRLPVSEADLRRLEDLYDGEVRRADRALGRIFAKLRELGLWDRTIVIVTADHGEEFDEHGLVAWHSLTCYEEVMRVPLIIKPARAISQPAARPATGLKRTGMEDAAADRAAIRDGGGPGSAPHPSLNSVRGPRSIATAVRTIDIAPTILEMAGIAPPAAMRGKSLTGLLAGGSEPDRLSICELEDGRGAALLAGGWKYHMRSERSVDDRRTPVRRLAQRGKYGAEELYELGSDPGERRNLIDVQPEMARRLRGLLTKELHAASELLAGLTQGESATLAPSMDAEHLERLRSLGYVE